jgi:hypothetical protein
MRIGRNHPAKADWPCVATHDSVGIAKTKILLVAHIIGSYCCKFHGFYFSAVTIIPILRLEWDRLPTWPQTNFSICPRGLAFEVVRGHARFFCRYMYVSLFRLAE